MLTKLRGVFYGWWIVAASFFLLLLCGGTALYGFSAFFDPIYNEMGWTRAETSLAFSLKSMESGMVAPVLGFFVDRIGSRKCIFVGILIMAGSLVLISRIANLSDFFIGFFMLALGNTFASGIPEYSAVAAWFRKRRALALGILTAGMGASGILTPVITRAIDTFGWRETLLIMTPVVVVIGIPLALLIRPRPEPYGYLPDGGRVTTTTQAGTTGKKQGPLPSQEEDGLTIKQCLATRTFWLLLLFSTFTSFASSAVQVHLMPHLVNVGISRDLAALAMTGYTVLSLVGRLGLAYFGDRYSKKKLLILSAILQAIGVAILAYVKTPWMIVPFLVFYAPGFGGPIPLLPAIQADYFGTKAFASVRGLMALGYTIPGIIAPWFAGWICDIQGSYTLAFLIASGLTLLAIPVMMMTTLTRGKATAARTEIISAH